MGPILTDKEKLALRETNDVTRIVSLDGKTAEDVIKERNVKNYNKMVDDYVEKFNEHTTKLEEYSKTIAENAEKIEILPLFNYVLVKQFEENPFQRIVKQGGIITDLGGQAIQYKNNMNGELEEEEQFIFVGVVQEIGPECKYLQPGDTIMYTKPAAVPIPFYKQGLILVNETRAMVVINEGLSERMKEIKKNKK